MHNDDGVENALENKNYSFSLFGTKNAFDLRDLITNTPHFMSFTLLLVVQLLEHLTGHQTRNLSPIAQHLYTF